MFRERVCVCDKKFLSHVTSMRSMFTSETRRFKSLRAFLVLVLSHFSTNIASCVIMSTSSAKAARPPSLEGYANGLHKLVNAFLLVDHCEHDKLRKRQGYQDNRSKVGEKFCYFTKLQKSANSTYYRLLGEAREFIEEVEHLQAIDGDNLSHKELFKLFSNLSLTKPADTPRKRTKKPTQKPAKNKRKKKVEDEDDNEDDEDYIPNEEEQPQPVVNQKVTRPTNQANNPDEEEQPQPIVNKKVTRPTKQAKVVAQQQVSIKLYRFSMCIPLSHTYFRMFHDYESHPTNYHKQLLSPVKLL